MGFYEPFVDSAERPFANEFKEVVWRHNGPCASCALNDYLLHVLGILCLLRPGPHCRERVKM